MRGSGLPFAIIEIGIPCSDDFGGATLARDRITTTVSAIVIAATAYLMRRTLIRLSWRTVKNDSSAQRTPLRTVCQALFSSQLRGGTQRMLMHHAIKPNTVTP